MVYSTVQILYLFIFCRVDFPTIESRVLMSLTLNMGFPDSPVGKESACNAEDTSSIPGLRRSSDEGIVYPLQCYWASLVAQLVKNLPVVWETWVQSLGWEDPPQERKDKATHSSILAWRIPRTRDHGVPKSQTRLSNFLFYFHLSLLGRGIYICYFAVYLLSMSFCYSFSPFYSVLI